MTRSIKVIKRDGRKVDFEKDIITTAIIKAMCEIGAKDEEIAKRISTSVCNQIKPNTTISVEEIQDLVEMHLKETDKHLYNAYHEYRVDRTRIRQMKTKLMQSINKIGIETDRDNANVGNNFSSKLLRIASESNKTFNLAKMPKHLAKLHENGDLYYHDLDSFNLTTNCLHIPTGEILKRGFNTGYGTIKPPKRLESASELSCILLQSTQNDMFGGQSHPNFDNDMADFVDLTRQEIYEEYSCLLKNESIDYIKSMTETKLHKIIHQSMQGIIYNLNTMHSRAGSQVPFSSVNIGIPKNEDAALVCQIFLEEYKRGLGKGEQPIFPNIIFRVKSGVNRNPEDPYHYLFKLACTVASERMNPTFMNIDADFNKMYYDEGVLPATMGCRTYICSNINGEAGVEGRGNIAPTTINLPRLGILAKCNIDKFFELLNEKLELAKESLLYRYDILKHLRVKDLPFVAGQGLMKGVENLSPDDSIEGILKQGSWAIGFIGLAEALTALTGKHHGEDENSRELGYRIIKYIREFTDKTTQETHLNWSCYQTPAEGLSGKFIIQDKEKFGIIKGVTDKYYYTNSCHVPVGCQMSIKDKIDIEAPFHKLCNGGHISYIELDDYPTPQTILDIINYAYQNTNISYMGINFHIRYCKDCGTYLRSGEQKCTNCGGANIQGISRVTGYLSLDERFGIGKVAEKKDRISHTTHKQVYQ